MKDIPFRLSFASCSAPGTRALGDNDDRVFVDDDAGLYAVIDASGPTYGGWHRPTGVDPGWSALRRAWLERVDMPIEARTREALRAANRAMYNPSFFRQRGPSARPWHPTASATVLAVQAPQAVVAQVGSARAYLVRDAQATLALADHTAPRGAGTGSGGRLITRVLGFAESVEVETRLLTLRLGDRLVLCTDGVWLPLTQDDDAALTELLGRALEPRALADALRERVERVGAPDHHSVLVLNTEVR